MTRPGIGVPVLKTLAVWYNIHFGVERVHRFIEDVEELLRKVEIRTLAEDIVSPLIVDDVDGCLSILRVMR